MEKLNELAYRAERYLITKSESQPEQINVSCKTILAIAEAFRALEQRAEAAEADLERESDIHIDTAESMREWRLRAEAAEAIVSDVNEIIGMLTEREWAEHCTKTETGKLLEELITELHDDASLASGLAELVPDEFTNDEVPCAMTDVIKAEMDGWNACRAEMLRNIKEAK